MKVTRTSRKSSINGDGRTSSQLPARRESYAVCMYCGDKSSSMEGETVQERWLLLLCSVQGILPGGQSCCFMNPLGRHFSASLWSHPRIDASNLNIAGGLSTPPWECVREFLSVGKSELGMFWLGHALLVGQGLELHDTSCHSHILYTFCLLNTDLRDAPAQMYRARIILNHKRSGLSV